MGGDLGSAAGQNHNEFLAPDPGSGITGAQIGLNGAPHGGQNLIARRMAKAVIDPFEMVQIHHQQGKPPRHAASGIAPGRALANPTALGRLIRRGQKPVDKGQDIAAVKQTRQRIGHCRFHPVAQLFAQPVQHRLAPDQGGHTGSGIFGVKGAVDHRMNPQIQGLGRQILRLGRGDQHQLHAFLRLRGHQA